MANKKAYIERDRHGRERIVFETNRHGSSTYTKPSTIELLDAYEEEKSCLAAEVRALQKELAAAQAASWEIRNLQYEYRSLCTEHHKCKYLRAQLDAQVRETRRVEDKLDVEKEKTEKQAEKIDNLEDKNEKLEEKLHYLKRVTYGSYKEKFEEKCKEADGLKKKIEDRDNVIRLDEARLADKNRTIIYLKNYLRDHGFRVE